MDSKKILCEKGYSGAKCQVDKCGTPLIYGFCIIHSGKELGLEKCSSCEYLLIEGYCMNDHDEKKKTDFMQWRKNFFELASSKDKKFKCICCAEQIPGELRCENGHDGTKCPISGCYAHLIYSFCLIHDGKKLGLEQCKKCERPLIDGDCYVDHNKKEIPFDEFFLDIPTFEEMERVDNWRHKFKTLAKSKNISPTV
jgi:hypothetical protein